MVKCAAANSDARPIEDLHRATVAAAADVARLVIVKAAAADVCRGRGRTRLDRTAAARVEGEFAVYDGQWPPAQDRATAPAGGGRIEQKLGSIGGHCAAARDGTPIAAIAVAVANCDVFQGERGARGDVKNARRIIAADLNLASTANRNVGCNNR